MLIACTHGARVDPITALGWVVTPLRFLSAESHFKVSLKDRTEEVKGMIEEVIRGMSDFEDNDGEEDGGDAANNNGGSEDGTHPEEDDRLDKGDGD